MKPEREERRVPRRFDGTDTKGNGQSRPLVTVPADDVTWTVADAWPPSPSRLSPGLPPYRARLAGRRLGPAHPPAAMLPELRMVFNIFKWLKLEKKFFQENIS